VKCNVRTQSPILIYLDFYYLRCYPINRLTSITVMYPRSDSRTGGTIGPTLSQDLGMRALDMGIPMMSMHSIRALTGSKDVSLGVNLWEGFLRMWGSHETESVLGELL